MKKFWASIFVIAMALAILSHGRRWLIPAFHATVDAGIPDAHDDPQNFDDLIEPAAAGAVAAAVITDEPVSADEPAIEPVADEPVAAP